MLWRSCLNKTKSILLLIFKLARHHNGISIPIILFICWEVGWSVYDRKYMESLIPAKIKLDGTIFVNREGGCGSGFFWVDDDVALEIENKGIKFFDDVTKSRDVVYGRFHASYRNWSKTPLPEKFFSEGSLFFCAGPDDLKKGLFDKIEKASKSTLGFYADYNYSVGKIIVIPKLKIIVIDYFD